MFYLIFHVGGHFIMMFDLLWIIHYVIFFIIFLDLINQYLNYDHLFIKEIEL